MFSSRFRLKRKTPPNGIERKEFIRLLVDEYYETTNVEAQEQVTANLANFSYDPLNFPYLTEARAVDLFLQLLGSPNEKLILHGIAGLCNLCLDPTSFDIIINQGGIETISSLLNHESNKIVENSISTLIQLDRTDTHPRIFATSNVAKIVALKQSPHPIIRNLSNLFLANRQDAVSSESTSEYTNTG